MTMATASDVSAFRSLDLARRREWIGFAIIMGIFWTVPLLMGGFYIYLASIIAVFATAALGLQLMVGLAGQLSLGHAAFLGIGAYTAALLQKNYGVSYPAAACGALSVAGLVGLLMAQLIRLSGVYFKIATFGFGVIVYQLISNSTHLTGGHTGLMGIPSIRIAAFEVTQPWQLFAVAASILTLVYILFIRLTQGRIGRAFRALGQNEDAAMSIGVPVNKYKMAVISLGCAAAGLAGSVLPHIYSFISPESFTWHESVVLLIMITIGGLGSLPGAVVGAALLVIIPEYLRDLAEYKMLVYGLLLIVSMALLPRGLAGLVEPKK